VASVQINPVAYNQKMNTDNAPADIPII